MAELAPWQKEMAYKKERKEVLAKAREAKAAKARRPSVRFKKAVRRSGAKTVKGAGKIGSRLTKKIATYPRRKKRYTTAQYSAGGTALLGAFGLTGQTKKAGPGRPRGTYKYGVPIQEYKKRQSMRQAVYQQYQEERLKRMKAKGYSPEQVQQLQMAQQLQMNKLQPIRTPPRSIAEDEHEFKEFVNRRTVTPTTQRILDQVRRIQLKSRADDSAQQRRIREKKMIEGATSILATPSIFKGNELDMTGVDPETNILMAPNTFREREDNPSILQERRGNVLDTNSYGNTLRF